MKKKDEQDREWGGREFKETGEEEEEEGRAGEVGVEKGKKK